MIPVALPTEPAVEVAVSRQDVLLPGPVRELLMRGECSLADAARFLGLSVKPDGTPGSTAYAMAERYRRRVMPVISKPPYDTKVLIPRTRGGAWVEIPNVKAGVIRVRTNLLVPMIWAELGWPA
jgi:hypothetical protein